MCTEYRKRNDNTLYTLIPIRCLLHHVIFPLIHSFSIAPNETGDYPN